MFTHSPIHWMFESVSQSVSLAGSVRFGWFGSVWFGCEPKSRCCSLSLSLCRCGPSLASDQFAHTNLGPQKFLGSRVLFSRVESSRLVGWIQAKGDSMKRIGIWPKQMAQSRHNTMQCNASQCNSMQFNASQCNSMQANRIQSTHTHTHFWGHNKWFNFGAPKHKSHSAPGN